MTEDKPSTGRLFRAASVDGDVHTDAIPALPSERARVEDVLPDEAFRTEVSDESTPAAAVVEAAAPPEAAASEPSPTVSADAGLTTLWVWVIIVGVTVVMAIADILVRKQGIGWLTGIGLLAASVYAAIAAQRSAMWWAVIAPPLAIALTILTVGQTTLARTGSLLLSEGLNLIESLGRTAPFTIGAVSAAAVICLVRRNRARRDLQP